MFPANIDILQTKMQFSTFTAAGFALVATSSASAVQHRAACNAVSLNLICLFEVMLTASLRTIALD